jgi:calcineurin-like phosphoesterase family protein
MNTFFTADLHFFHRNVIRFCNRPWKNVEDMNEGLIENWNKTVSNDDEIYILGDMFFCGVTKAKEILEMLNGRKYLILGNHDWNIFKPQRAKEFCFISIEEYAEILFNEKYFFRLSHFPYKGTGDYTEEERFSDKRLFNSGHCLLHGHVHNEWIKKDNMINVGIDVWDYKPVSLNEIIGLINK